MNKISLKKAGLTVLLAIFSLVSASAQPSAVKKACSSVFTLTTFKADGSINGSTHGVFTGGNGEAISMWHPFNGATRAVVVDASGQQYDVDVLIGASELYDVCRFRVKGKGANPLPLTTNNQAATSVYLIDYSVKKPSVKKIAVSRSEKFLTTDNYYVFNDNNVASVDLGCPIVNEAGELLGIMQRPINGGQAFSTDARLTTTFKITGLTLNDPTLRTCGIRTALPTDEEQATLTLMLAGEMNDSVKYTNYINDFIRQFPSSAVGYTAEARRLVGQKRFADADAMFEQGVKHATAKDEAYSDYAKTVYESAIFKIDTTFTKWNLPYAQKLSEEAYKAKPLAVYKHQTAQAIFAQGDIQKALQMFTELQSTEMGQNGEVFFEAAQCKQRLGAPQKEIMALLDSAVNAQSGSASAPYVLARGRAYDNQGETRKAFNDYLLYDSLMYNRATPEFYYTKFHCEMKLHQYQLALNDIAHAIVLNRKEPTYYAEMASLQLRVNQLDDAVKTCDIAMQLSPDYADLYIIKGIAQCELKKKQDGLATLQKAKQLGDTRADELIQKYSK